MVTHIEQLNLEDVLLSTRCATPPIRLYSVRGSDNYWLPTLIKVRDSRL